ncbi:MAG TPA: hypothetical protein VKT82_18940 [Ktedonobacterales bacterium]|nr:hypothetical protein [Ktedonobacterales bacterium]
MQPLTRRWGAVFALSALLMIAALSGCLSDTNGLKGTPTSVPHATATGTPDGNGTPVSGGTPTPTPTPPTACAGKLSDIVLPAQAVQVGTPVTSSATTNCDYQVPQALKTVDAFFKTQMAKSGWTLLHDNPEGPLAQVQQYFKKQRFATISLSQHGSDAKTTDVTITVESSQ